MYVFLEAYRAANELVKTEQKKKRCDDLSEYMHACMYVYTCMYVCMYTCMYVCMCMFLWLKSQQKKKI